MVNQDNIRVDVRPPPLSFRNKYLQRVSETPAPAMIIMNNKKVIYGEEHVYYNETDKLYRNITNDTIVFGYRKP